MLQVSVGTNNKISSNIATIGNLLKVSIVSSTTPSLEINGETKSLQLVSGVYSFEIEIDESFDNGFLDIQVSNQSDSYSNNSIKISSDFPTVNVTVTKEPLRLGNRLVIDVVSNKDLATNPRISFGDIKMNQIDNYEEIVKSNFIWSKTNNKIWQGVFEYTIDIILNDFELTFIDEAGNISTFQTNFQGQVDYGENNQNSPSFIKNKPNLNVYQLKETGKGLSTNDYTNVEKNKLSGISSGAQVNLIEEIKVNDSALPINSKSVNIIIPPQIQADYSETNQNSLAFIKNKPDLEQFGGVEQFASFSLFPTTGNIKKLYIDKSKNVGYYWNGDEYFQLEDYFKENILVSLSAGKSLGPYTNGMTIPSIGKTVKEVIKLLAIEVQNPTLIAPTFSLTGNSGSFREVGENFNVLLTFNFNRGNILGSINGNIWDPNLSQGSRAGIANFYRFWKVGGSTNNSSNNTFTLNNNVMQGVNTFNANVNFENGMQPLNSIGENFSTPLSGGDSANQSFSFEGVFPLFGTTSSITIMSKQSLVSMISGNNIQINLVSESGTDKQKIAIPNAWITSRPLLNIEYFNTLTGQWDTTNRLSEWSILDSTFVIQGQGYPYKLYTFNGLNRGAISVRLKF